MRNVILMALAVLGAACMGGSDSSSGNSFDNQPPPLNKSEIIFYAIDEKGIEVENVYTANGSEIKKAFGLDDSGIEDNSTIAFIIFSYSTPEGVDKKLLLVVTTIYTALSAEPSIDGVLVMPYDPSLVTTKASLVYTNRSHAKEVAAQKLPLRKIYNMLDIYIISAEAG